MSVDLRWHGYVEAPTLSPEARAGDVGALLADCLAARWKAKIVQPVYPEPHQIWELTITRTRYLDDGCSDVAYENRGPQWYVTEKRQIIVSGKTLAEACQRLGEACDALRGQPK